MFPVTPNQKDPPLVKWRSLGTTRPRDQVVRAFRRFPTANIGVVCGALSGLTVLDIDIKPWEGKRGHLTLATLVKEHGPLPDTPQQRTWSGGLQVFFRYAPGTPNSSGQIGHGLDIRSEGGYCVVAPSYVEKDGRSGVYEWIVPHTVALAPMPGWLLDRVDACPASSRPPCPGCDGGLRSTISWDNEANNAGGAGMHPAGQSVRVRWEGGREGPEGVDVDYAPACLGHGLTFAASARAENAEEVGI